MRFSANIQVILFAPWFKLVWPAFPTGDGQSERESVLQANGIFQINHCVPESAVCVYSFLCFHPRTMAHTQKHPTSEMVPQLDLSSGGV